MRLMIIRIGDEKRQLIDDHIKKLKDLIVQEDIQKFHKAYAVDTFVTCIVNLPHKALIYAALLALIATENESFTSGP